MKTALLILLFSIAAYAQGSTRTVPQYHHWERIMDNEWVGAKGDGTDTTDAFSPLWWEGVTTLFFQTDTTGGGASDSCMTIFYQLKRKYTYPENGVVDEDWGGWYGDATAVTRTKIDTVARSYSNRNGVFFIDPAGVMSSGWAWGDSMRFILKIGTGDSLRVTVDVGGQ